MNTIDFYLKKVFSIFFAFIFMCYLPLLCGAPDLTIVGFLEPEGGIGKVPITIIETLDDRVSMNFYQSSPYTLKHEIPDSVKKVLENLDASPGKVALLTDVIAHYSHPSYQHVPQGSLIKIAYSMLETTRIPNLWVNILNEEFDAVVVPDPFLLSIYQDSGVHIPIFVLPIPMNLNPYFERRRHSKSPFTPFTFIDASVNKNPALLIDAFAKAFGNSQDVHLIMRAGVISNATQEIIHCKVAEHGLTNITVQNGHVSSNQMIDILTKCDCYVNFSKGEGFSLIPRESLALGIPVIISDNTASTTICRSGCVLGVPSRKMVPANPGYRILFNEDCGEQFDCELEDVSSAFLNVYQDYGKYIEKARRGRKWVNQYNSANPTLQNRYETLVKPKRVVLSSKNQIDDGVLKTNSKALYKKYKQIIKEAHRP